MYVRKDDIIASARFGKLPAGEQQTIRAALDRYDGIRRADRGRRVDHSGRAEGVVRRRAARRTTSRRRGEAVEWVRARA
jgi:hypothetical protein